MAGIRIYAPSVDRVAAAVRAALAAPREAARA
jgi:hypothetical protein